MRTFSTNNGSGQGYLSQIDYTGNGATAPTNQVKFYLENRTDTPVMYTSNFPITIAKRLKTIEVLANGVRQRAYAFAHWSDGTTARMLLVSVQQFGKDATLDVSGTVTGGTPLPPVLLRYGQDVVGLNPPAQWIQHGGTFQAGQAQYADVNGDGMADMIFQGGTGAQFFVSLSTGTGFTAPAMWVQHGGSFQAEQAQYADLNGDGRADLVFQGTDNKFWVSLSTGTGFTVPAMWLQHSGTFQAGMMRYVDLNGDGRTDLILQGTDNKFWVSLSTGGGLTLPALWVQHGCCFQAGQAQYADLNGDGMGDLIMQGTDNKFWVSVSTVQDTVQNTIPNFLHTLSNGLGGATTVTYLPSTQWPNQQLPFAVQTVNSLTTCDNWNSGTSTCNGTSSTTTYSYTGGYHQIGERDFRGFKTAVVTSPGATDADKTVTITWFHQGNELTPIDTENPGLANGYMKGHPYRVEVRRKSDNVLYTKTETAYHDDRIGANTTPPWFTPLSQVDTSICDGGPCATTRVAIAAADYDAYGNVLRESHHGDMSVLGDEKTVERAFVPANTTDYLVSVPARETIYQGVPAGTKLAETLFYYDGTGTGACTAAPTGSTP